MITVGSNVIVEIDGEKYNLTVNEGGSYTVNSGTMSCSFYIGKSGASGYIDTRAKTTDVTDGPCFIAINSTSDPAYLSAMFLFANGVINAEHSVSIYVSGGSFKTIDPKYIPSNITYFISSGAYYRTGSDWETGKEATISDIVSAYHNGGARIFLTSDGNIAGVSDVISANPKGAINKEIAYLNITTGEMAIVAE